MKRVKRKNLSFLATNDLDEKLIDLSKKYECSKSKLVNVLLSFCLQESDREKLIAFLDKKLKIFY